MLDFKFSYDKFLCSIQNMELMDFYLSLFIFFASIFFTFYLLLMNLNWQGINTLKSFKKETINDMDKYQNKSQETEEIIKNNMKIINGVYKYIIWCLFFIFVCYFSKLFPPFWVFVSFISASICLGFILWKTGKIIIFFRSEQNSIPKVINKLKNK